MNNDYVNKACDVSKRATKIEDNFPLSNHKATSAFELVHYNIWGPIKLHLHVMLIIF